MGMRATIVFKMLTEGREPMMGLFRREKGRYEGIPDEKLNRNQQQQKKMGE